MQMHSCTAQAEGSKNSTIFRVQPIFFSVFASFKELRRRAALHTSNLLHARPQERKSLAQIRPPDGAPELEVQRPARVHAAVYVASPRERARAWKSPERWWVEA